MAGSGDIRGKIILEGEQEYSRALKDAQRNLRVLRSELKAETAEMGKNASEQDKAAAKTKNLKQQISEQEKIVKTYESALKELRENYADNEDAIARWEIKLNDARTALANMRNGLEDTGKGFESIATGTENGISAAHDFAESLEKIADVGSSVSSSIESVFFGIVDNIRGAISSLWSQLSEAAARANSWTDLGAMFGTNASEIQQWFHATRAGGKDFNSLVSMGNKILTGDAHKIAEATGIDITGYTNQWEAFYHVMRELSEMDQPEQIAALQHMGINGPKEAGWLDMLNAWGDIVKNLDTFDAENGGLGMSAEDLEKMNQLSLNAQKLNESWSAFKESWLAGLAPLALDITGNLQEIIEALNEYLNAESPEEKEAALAKIRTNVEEIFAAIRDAFENGIGLLGELASSLKESEDPMARALGDMLDKLVGALNWFADEKNWKAVETGFKAIIGVWATGHITSALTNIAAFLSNVGLIMTGKWIAGGSAAGGAAAGGGIGSWFSGIGTWIATKAPWLANLGTGAAQTLGPIGDWFAHNTSLGRTLFEQQTFEDLKDDVAKKADEIKENASTFFSDWGELLGNLIGRDRKETKENVEENQQAAGIETFGDEVKNVQRFGQKQNQRAMGAMWGAVWGNGGGGQEEPAAPTVLTPEQTAALEAYWDMTRGGEYDRETYVELQNAFGDNLELMNTLVDALDGLPDSEFGSEDIPADWWQTQTQVQKELPGKIEEASERGANRGIVTGLRGVSVYLDGAAVGRLITPIVSENLARDLVV